MFVEGWLPLLGTETDMTRAISTVLCISYHLSMNIYPFICIYIRMGVDSLFLLTRDGSKIEAVDLGIGGWTDKRRRRR